MRAGPAAAKLGLMAGEMLELAVGGDKALLGRVVKRVTRVIAASFEADGCRQTQLAVRQRFEILEAAIRQLRRELGWSWPRILDELPRALRAKLDRVPWDPSKGRGIWAPEDPDEGRILWTPDGDL